MNPSSQQGPEGTALTTGRMLSPAISTNTYSSGRLIGRREHDRRFARQDAKRERLLKIKPHGSVCVTEIADRDILPDIELEIASSRGQHKRTFDRRGPDDIAIYNPLHVL